MARRNSQPSIDAQIRQLDRDIQRLVSEMEREGATPPPSTREGELRALRDKHAWVHRRLQQLRQSSPEVWWI